MPIEYLRIINLFTVRPQTNMQFCALAWPSELVKVPRALKLPVYDPDKHLLLIKGPAVRTPLASPGCKP